MRRASLLCHERNYLGFSCLEASVLRNTVWHDFNLAVLAAIKNDHCCFFKVVEFFPDWMHSFCLFLLLKAVLKTDYLCPNSGDMWFDFIVWSWGYVLHVSFIVYCWFSLTWSAAMFFNRNKRESLRMNRTQFPEDLSATPRWLPFLCLGALSWSLWRHLKTNDTLLYL